MTARLSQNALLIDGNLTAGAGIDLGLPAPAEDAQSRNIGLDFLNPTEVNRLLVWVDRDLPVEVANSFSWEIYSSPDNVIWRRETGVSAAPFGPFENRFQIDFPAVTARYVKVVTRPLSVGRAGLVAFPGHPRDGDAGVPQAAGGRGQRQADADHPPRQYRREAAASRRAVAVLRGVSTCTMGRTRSAASTDTLSNGVSVNHSFGRIFSVYARGAREQGTQPQGYRVATVTNATLTVEPIPTFRSSLLYTGQDERDWRAAEQPAGALRPERRAALSWS